MKEPEENRRKPLDHQSFCPIFPTASKLEVVCTGEKAAMSPEELENVWGSSTAQPSARAFWVKLDTGTHHRPRSVLVVYQIPKFRVDTMVVSSFLWARSHKSRIS